MRRSLIYAALAIGLALPVHASATTSASKAGVNATRPCGEVVDGDGQLTGKYVGLLFRVANNDTKHAVTARLTLELSADSQPLAQPTMKLGKALAQPVPLPRIPICPPSADYLPKFGEPCYVKSASARNGMLRWVCSMRIPAYSSRQVGFNFDSGFGHAGELIGSFWATAGKITSKRVPVDANINPA